MDTVDLQEAARRLHRSEKTLRRWILKTKTLPAQLVHGRYRIAVKDIEALAATLPADDERIATLEQRVGELEDRLGMIEHLYTLEHQKPTYPQKMTPRPLQPQKQPSEGDTLPAGYVPIFDLIKEHGLTRQRQAIIRHMKPWIHEGHWRRAGHAIEKALDPQGQAEFLRRYVTQS